MTPFIKALLLIGALALSACATHRPELKAPCDPLTCTDRTQVNSWYKE